MPQEMLRRLVLVCASSCLLSVSVGCMPVQPRATYSVLSNQNVDLVGLDLEAHLGE